MRNVQQFPFVNARTCPPLASELVKELKGFEPVSLQDFTSTLKKHFKWISKDGTTSAMMDLDGFSCYSISGGVVVIVLGNKMESVDLSHLDLCEQQSFVDELWKHSQSSLGPVASQSVRYSMVGWGLSARKAGRLPTDEFVERDSQTNDNNKVWADYVTQFMSLKVDLGLGVGFGLSIVDIVAVVRTPYEVRLKLQCLLGNTHQELSISTQGYSSSEVEALLVKIYSQMYKYSRVMNYEYSR